MFSKKDHSYPKNYFRYLIVCLLLLLGVSVCALLEGVHGISFMEMISILMGSSHPYAYILLDIRLPRLLLVLMSGAMLTCGGYLMQALIKNPLADPYIMGVTAGAGLGVNLLILGIIPIAGFSIFTKPLLAGLGSCASLFLVVVLGFNSLKEDTSRLLIAGVAVASLCTALTGILIYTQADSDQVRKMVFWTFGSFTQSSWQAVYMSSFFAGLGIGLSWLFSRQLDIMMLGDIDAQVLGMNIKRFKIGVLLLASICVGGIVAFTGPIGFVGMMVPHFMRGIIGPMHRYNIMLGCLLGAVYLAACHVLSRFLLPPQGLPIGIVTAILGVPFFLYILFKKETYL